MDLNIIGGKLWITTTTRRANQHQGQHTCDEKSIKVLGQWFYFWSQTKILFVESKPVEMSNDYDSSNLD